MPNRDLMMDTNLPLTLIERLLATTIASVAQSAFKWGQPSGSQLLVPALNALGPRAEFPAPSQAALIRCWWVDCDTESVALDLDMLNFLAKMHDCWPHRPLQFTDHAMTLASAAGRIDILDWWIARVGFDKCKYNEYTVMREAAAAGELGVLQWWRKMGAKLDFAYTARFAANGGNTQVLEWCVGEINKAHARRGSLKIDEVLSAASTNGHIHVLDWWLRSGLNIDSVPSLAGACKQGQLDVLEWWLKLSLASHPETGAKYPPLVCTTEYLCSSLLCCIFEQNDPGYSVFKWWIDSGLVSKELVSSGIAEDPPFSKWPRSPVLCALRWGHGQPIDILDTKGLLPRPIPMTLFTSAFQSGHAPLIDWIWKEYLADCPELVAMTELVKSVPQDNLGMEKVYPFFNDWYGYAAKQGLVEMMDWLFTQFPLDTALFELNCFEYNMAEASEHGHVNILEWCDQKRDRIYPGRQLRSENVACAMMSACWGHHRRDDIEKVLKWWASSRHWEEWRATEKEPSFLLETVRDRLWKNGDLGMIDWWCSTQCPMPKELGPSLVDDATVAMLDWAAQRGIKVAVGTDSECATRIVDNASNYNRVATLQWLYSSGYPMVCSAIAFSDCKRETLAWWVEIAKLNPHVRTDLGRCLKQSGHVELLQRFEHLFGKC